MDMESIPPTLISDIEILLQKGENPVQPNPGFNDSLIAEGALIPIIQGIHSHLTSEKEDVKLAEDVTILTHFLTGAKYTETEQAKLILEVCLTSTPSTSSSFSTFLY